MPVVSWSTTSPSAYNSTSSIFPGCDLSHSAIFSSLSIFSVSKSPTIQLCIKHQTTITHSLAITVHCQWNLESSAQLHQFNLPSCNLFSPNHTFLSPTLRPLQTIKNPALNKAPDEHHSLAGHFRHSLINWTPVGFKFTSHKVPSSRLHYRCDPTWQWAFHRHILCRKIPFQGTLPRPRGPLQSLANERETLAKLQRPHSQIAASE